MSRHEFVGTLQIRPDEEAGLIRATLEFPGGQPPVLLAAMSLRLAECDKRNFAAWLDWLKGAVKRFGMSAGCDKVSFDEFGPGDLN